MDDFELEIKNEFINESLMNLEEVEGSFMDLESAEDKKPLLDKIFRLAHNLKGGSRAVGFGEVAEFTHQLENLVLKIQKGESALTQKTVTTLLKSNDRLIEMLNALKSDLNATFNNQDILSEIEQCINTTQVDSIAAAPVKAVNKVEELIQENPTEELNLESLVVKDEDLIQPPAANSFFDVETAPVPQNVEPISAVKTKEAPVAVKEKETNKETVSASNKDDEIIRVNLSKINKLNDYVGELIVLQSVAQQQAMFGDKSKTQITLRQMAKLSKEIQYLSMGLRMLPVKPLVQKLQRVIRDTAQSLGKQVQFVAVGDQMDIDKSVLDRLSDPLIHILRNAVDHGLENPQERTESGKNAQGTITLNFQNEGNQLVISISDDGKGINTEVLRKKAIEKKIISENDQLSEKQLINLIFHAGFSTKAVTSEISGRGVGMDVVKTNIDKIGGKIDITTEIKKGSVFKLFIPLTLAVVDGLVIESEKNRYVVPLSQVQETLNLKTVKVFSDKTGVGWCFELRNQVIPLLFLEQVLGDAKSNPKIDGTALIVSVQDKLIAIGVHDVVRAQQIVIKPFANGIIPQKGWVGTCVLGDGLPTLILSPIDMLTGKITHSLMNTSTNIGGAA